MSIYGNKSSPARTYSQDTASVYTAAWSAHLSLLALDTLMCLLRTAPTEPNLYTIPGSRIEGWMSVYGNNRSALDPTTYTPTTRQAREGGLILVPPPAAFSAGYTLYSYAMLCFIHSLTSRVARVSTRGVRDKELRSEGVKNLEGCSSIDSCCTCRCTQDSPFFPVGAPACGPGWCKR